MRTIRTYSAHGSTWGTGAHPTPAAARVAAEAMDRAAALDLYRALMLKAGHLVPRKPGEDRSLPCGYDPFDPPISASQDGAS